MLYSFEKMPSLHYAKATCVTPLKSEDCTYLLHKGVQYCDSLTQCFAFRLTDGYSREQLESRLQWWIDQTRGTSLSDNADPVRDRIILVARVVTGKF